MDSATLGTELNIAPGIGVVASSSTGLLGRGLLMTVCL
jgi:hypothetical protein